MKELFLRINDRDMTCLVGQSWGYVRRPKQWVQAALAVAGLASSLISGISASRKQAEAEAAQRRKESSDEARYLYNSNVTGSQTASGKNAIRQAKEQADKEVKRAEGSAAMGGGTDAAVAQAKEQGNKLVSDTIGNVEAQGTQQKANAEQMKAAADAQNTATDIQLAQQSAQNTAQIGAAASDAFSQAAAYASSLGGSGSKTTGAGLTPTQVKSGLDTAWNNSQATMANSGQSTISQTLAQRNQQAISDFAKRAAGRTFTLGPRTRASYPNILNR